VTDVVVVSSYLPGEEPKRSEFPVHPIECTGEFSYCHGLAGVWAGDATIVNVERDMEFSDELVQGLLDCPHPACMYPYQVFPTKLQRFIYCATTTSVAEAEWAEYRANLLRIHDESFAGIDPDDDQLLLGSGPLGPGTTERPDGWIQPRWVEPGDEWAEWASIGFCKIAPEVRTQPLDRMFWQWLEHAINRAVSSNSARWHLHWPEVQHLHDYKVVPDHLW
jgi:hypothetical protein